MRENKGKKPRRLQLWDRTHTTAASRKANKGKKGAVSVQYAGGHENSGKYKLALIFIMFYMHLFIYVYYFIFSDTHIHLELELKHY